LNTVADLEKKVEELEDRNAHIRFLVGKLIRTESQLAENEKRLSTVIDGHGGPVDIIWKIHVEDIGQDIESPSVNIKGYEAYLTLRPTVDNNAGIMPTLSPSSRYVLHIEEEPSDYRGLPGS
jgi:hypothetical protein